MRKIIIEAVLFGLAISTGVPSLSFADDSQTNLSAPAKDEHQAITPPTLPITPHFYHVKFGDTVQNIAKRLGVSPEDVRLWNNLDSNHIYLGQRLVIKGGNVSELIKVSVSADPATVTRLAALVDSPKRAVGVTSYTLRLGDTLHSVARRFHVQVADLMRWNAHQAMVALRPGDKIKLYLDQDSAAAPEPTVTAEAKSAPESTVATEAKSAPEFDPSSNYVTPAQIERLKREKEQKEKLKREILERQAKVAELNSKIGKTYWARPAVPEYEIPLKFYRKGDSLEFMIKKSESFTVVDLAQDTNSNPVYLIKFSSGQEAYIPVEDFKVASGLKGQILIDDPVKIAERERLAEAKARAQAAVLEKKARQAAAKRHAAWKARGGVHLGMTKAEVLRSNWGRPERIYTHSSVGLGVIEVWMYDLPNSLTFRNGILFSISN